jgi:methylated-DNA-[protein]-cysteine S-methyltransferase
MDRMEHVIIPPLGLTLHWNGERLVRIGLSWQKGTAGVDGKSRFCLDLHDALGRYLVGERVVWPDLPLEMGRLSNFSRNVLTTLRDRIGWGDLTTYKDLAALCGRPGAARAVGSVMRSNPWPLAVPCHRVIGSGGGLTGFGPGLPMKEFLLGLEASWPVAVGRSRQALPRP